MVRPASRSRRASRPRPSFPPRTADALDAGLAALGLDLARAGADGDRRPRPAAARLDRRDQPDGDPRSGSGRRRSRHSTACRPSTSLRERGVDTVHRPRFGRRLPGPPARGGAARRRAACSSSRSARRPASSTTVDRGDGSVADRVEAAAVRAEALAGDDRPPRSAGRPSPPAPSRASPTSSSWRCRCSSRAASSSLEARRPRRRARAPRTGARRARRRHGRDRRRSPSPASTAIASSWSRASAASPTAYPRDPGRAASAAVVSGSLLG